MTTTVRIPPAGDGFYAAAKRPENLTREQKGLDLFRSRRSEFVRISRDVVEVPSCTQRGVYYRVDFTEKQGVAHARTISAGMRPASISPPPSFTGLGSGELPAPSRRYSKTMRERRSSMDAPAMRRDEVTGHPRPFRADELASMKTVADSNPALLLSDPAIQGDRPIACECGHAILGRHNNDVSAARRRLNAPVAYL